MRKGGWREGWVEVQAGFDLWDPHRALGSTSYPRHHPKLSLRPPTPTSAPPPPLPSPGPSRLRPTPRPAECYQVLPRRRHLAPLRPRPASLPGRPQDPAPGSTPSHAPSHPAS